MSYLVQCCLDPAVIELLLSQVSHHFSHHNPYLLLPPGTLEDTYSSSGFTSAGLEA